MAGEEDEILVTIEGEDAPPEPDTVVKVEEPKAESKPRSEPKPQDDDIIATLRSQLAAQTQRATTAESQLGHATQRAHQAEQEATQARSQAAESTKATIDSGIAAARSEADAAEIAYKTAFEAGNAGDAAKAQRRIARAEADLAYLEQAKAELPAKAPPKAEPKPQIVDQFEDFLSKHTAPTANWMRAHRDYVTDPNKWARVQSAHYAAVGDGIALDTPAYFAHVEKTLGMNAPEPKPTTQRRPTAPTAPVTQTSGGMNGGSAAVTLTKGERDAATDGTHVWNYDDLKGRFKKGDAIGVQEFARRKLAIMQGKSNLSYHNSNVDGT